MRRLTTLLASLIAIATFAFPIVAQGTTFTVNSTDDVDDGTCNGAHCSLREALTAAQAAGSHTINFSIPGAGVHTIVVSASNLPGIARTLTIDGYSQPGSSPNTNATGAINAVPLIEIRTLSVSGLTVNNATVTIRGLILNGAASAKIAQGGGTLTVAGNFIGTNAAGTAAFNTVNPGAGIQMNGFGTLIVGGTNPADRNVISGHGNSVGIGVGESSDVTVQGNLIGTDKSGAAAIPNQEGFHGFGCLGGNINAHIGGTTPAERNVISGNSGFGIDIEVSVGCGVSANGTFVKGNFIGTDASGTLPIPNGTGISIEVGPNVAIGGRAAGEPNIIAFNTGRGVVVRGASNGMSILSNVIHSNGALGIDIDGNGVTPNDPGDADVNRPNFPIITNIVRGGSSTNITGTFDAPTTGNYLLQFFDNAAIDASSHGEGQTLMAELLFTVAATGTQSFDFTNNVALAANHFLTVTVTDPSNNTSEFSEAIADLTLTHTDAPDPAATGQNVTHTFTVTNTDDDFPSGPVTLTYTLHPSATFVSAPGGGTFNAGVVTFNLGTLAIGATTTRTVVVKYGSAGSFDSSAAITSPVTDPAPATNSASATTTVTGVALFFTISGTVRDAGNAGVPNVLMTLSGSQSGTVMTNAQGQYAFTDLAVGGAYTITPSQTGQTFTPLSRTFADLQANQISDFALVSAPTGFTISGQVRDLNDTGVRDVTVTLSGTQAGTRTTDAEGRYAFAGLGAGGTYTVTPSLTTFAFNPPSQTFPNLQANQFASFFIAQVGTFTRYFAEGATGSFFDTSFALLNATPLPLTATARFQREDGQVIAKTLQMPALTRATIDPKTIPGLEAAAFSTVIESNEPVIADRTMHWDASGYGSHMETSITRPLTRWYLAEGATTGAFNLFYLIQNPTTTDANVEIQYLRPAPAAPITKTHVVKANSRFSLYVNGDDPALDDAEISAVITSLNDVPIIVERSMYLDSAGQLFGAGHGSAAVADLSTHWFFAEGATGPFFNLFVLIANPGSTDAQIEARYLLPSGQVITKQYLSAAHSRLTIGVHAEGAELANTPVSTVLTSTNNVPVLAERAMWWPAAPLAPEWTEGHNSAGAVQTGEKWGLAEGEEGGAASQQTYVLIANTSDFTGTVQVKLIFEDGTTTQLDTPLSVPANSRTTISIGGTFPSAAGRRFGVIVESLGAPAAQLVVERALYNDAIIRGQRVTWAAGANAMGTRLR